MSKKAVKLLMSSILFVSMFFLTSCSFEASSTDLSSTDQEKSPSDGNQNEGEDNNVTPTPSPTATPEVPLICPTGYVLVPTNTQLNVSQFCVAQYEMRNVGGLPSSISTSLPWANVSRNTALAACQSLGSQYDLISNSQYQTLARNISSMASNWSSGVVGTGYMNIGNTDSWGSTLCDSSSEYVNTSCVSISSAGNFILKRTHDLTTGGIVWDLGGNNYEVMKDLSTAGQYSATSVCAGSTTNTNPGSDALGSMLDAFGVDASTWNLDTSTDSCGFLGLALLSSNNVSTPKAILRGGSTYDKTGIFHADIGWLSSAQPEGALSFRCVYR